MLSFLMHRVELKASPTWIGLTLMVRFLMHRVELKDEIMIKDPHSKAVPNAPCGVESLLQICSIWILD